MLPREADPPLEGKFVSGIWPVDRNGWGKVVPVSICGSKRLAGQGLARGRPKKLLPTMQVRDKGRDKVEGICGGKCGQL